MVMTKNNYLTNWVIFIDYIVSLFDSGRDEIDISQEFRGGNVEWEGHIAEIKLDEEYSPGVALAMKPETLPMSKGKVLRADYLFLNTNEKTRSSWSGCRVGDKVKFRAVIAKAAGPFPEIQLSVDDEDPEVLLMMGLYECELISVI